MQKTDPRITAHLRQWLDPQAELRLTDEEILEFSEGTFYRARVELRVAYGDFTEAIKDGAIPFVLAIMRVVQKLTGRLP